MDERSNLPPDDLERGLALARPDTDADLSHIALAGNTYTVLLSGAQTAGNYCLIDMYVPPGGGPPPHRHDFEEMFSVLTGEVEVTFRGESVVLKAGETANIPANAPHSFANRSQSPARLLCLCAPAGQEVFFAEVGDAVSSRTAPSPELDDAQKAERAAKAQALAPRFRTEML